MLLIKAESAVNLPPMANSDHLHHQQSIKHLINDAVIPHTHPLDPGFSLKSNAVGRPGIIGQQINGCARWSVGIGNPEGMAVREDTEHLQARRLERR